MHAAAGKWRAERECWILGLWIATTVPAATCGPLLFLFLVPSHLPPAIGDTEGVLANVPAGRQPDWLIVGWKFKCTPHSGPPPPCFPDADVTMAYSAATWTPLYSLFLLHNHFLVCQVTRLQQRQLLAFVFSGPLFWSRSAGQTRKFAGWGTGTHEWTLRERERDAVFEVCS